MSEGQPASPSSLEQFLQSIALFSLVEPLELPVLGQLVHPETLAAGQVLFRESEPVDSMWVLGPGVEVRLSTTQGGTRPSMGVAVARAGETVGEMALVDSGDRSATAEVTRGGTAYRIDAADFSRLRASFSPVAYQVMRKICMELCARLRSTDERIAPSAMAPTVPASIKVEPVSEPKILDAFPALQSLPQVVKLALSQRMGLIETFTSYALFSEGDEADAAYFVLSGEVTVGRGGRVINRLGGGSMFGLVALIDKGKRSATCAVEGPTRLLRLSKREFEYLFAAGNRFAFQVVDMVARQLVAHLRTANELLAPIPAPLGTPAAPEELLNKDFLPLELELALGELKSTASE